MIKKGTRVRLSFEDGHQELVTLDEDAYVVSVYMDDRPIRMQVCYNINGEYVPVSLVDVLEEVK